MRQSRVLLVASAWIGATWSRSRISDHVTQTSSAAAQAYGQLPLSFEANAGQTDPQVDFISRGNGHTLFLTPREAVLSLRATVLRMKFVGSEAKPRLIGQQELPGKVNYFIGKDPKRWRTGISTYAKVAYEDLYPGVDLVYYGNQRQLEYDFVVSPGVNPNIIALNFDGADQLQVDAQGELVLHASGGEIRQRKPLVYQEVDGVRHEVAGSYKLKDRNTVGFQLADYDASRPLVIDPVLVYSTFLGSSTDDIGWDIDVDTSGNAYVIGHTQQLTFPSNFPTTAGAFDTTHNGDQDVFVTKLNPSGSALVYSTFLGGRLVDIGNGIALDTFGSVYITGQTTSSNFPTTAGAFDTTYNGGFDAFVVKLGINGLPATLTLNPPAATNPVDSQHCVTATVQDASGNPVSNVVVRFQVMGAINTTGSTTTDSNGDATFCYFGPPLPGADTITTFADTDNSNVQDPGEPSAVAMKTWVLPATTPLCAITNGGWIIAANDDRANFGGSAKANETGETQGHEEYLDHGPAQGLNMHLINVQAIVCDGSSRASIFGQATINGSGLFNYRINVQEVGGPGRGQDTYQLLMDSYDSGAQTLRGGNVEIRRK